MFVRYLMINSAVVKKAEPGVDPNTQVPILP